MCKDVRNQRKNLYSCKSCWEILVSTDNGDGVTPFMIGCPNCGGEMYSQFYQVSEILKRVRPHIEWVKEDEGQLRERANKIVNESSKEWKEGIINDLDENPVDFMFEQLKEHSDNGGLHMIDYDTKEQL